MTNSVWINPVLLLPSILLLALFSPRGVSSQQQQQPGNVLVSEADQAAAIDAVQQLITDNNAPGSPIRNPLAKLVRLSFHDCVGSCDGCLNLDNLDNLGLEPAYNEISDLYNSNFRATGISRADFIALAGVVAVREASLQACLMPGGGGGGGGGAGRKRRGRRQMPPPPPATTEPCTEPVLEIRYGRKDCATSPNTTRVVEFPNPHSDLDHVMEVFRDGMGMTERQVVALMGAHSLGSGTPDNSGFLGPWAPPASSLDNGFYMQLVNLNNRWGQETLMFPESPVHPDPRFQWNTADANITARMPGRMMLNTDMSLFKHMQPNANGRETVAVCREDFRQCNSSRTASIVMEYANDNELWQQDFAVAYQILVQNGYEDDQLVLAGEEPTNGTNTDGTDRPTSGATPGLSHGGYLQIATITLPLLLLAIH